MNARKGRPAHKRVRRWRTWGCAVAMGIAATPFTNASWAHSQPAVPPPGAVLATEHRLPDGSGSAETSSLSHLQREIWNQIDRQVNQWSAHLTSIAEASSASSATVSDDGLEPRPSDLAEPREWTAPADEVAPLPPHESPPQPTRLDVRKRMIAVLGLTTVPPSPGGQESSRGTPVPSESEPAALDGFRAKAAEVARARAARRQVETIKAPARPAAVQAIPATLTPSTDPSVTRLSSYSIPESEPPTREAEPKVAAEAQPLAPPKPQTQTKRPPRVTPVTPAKPMPVPVQAEPLEAAQADFQLDSLETPRVARAMVATPRVWDESEEAVRSLARASAEFGEAAAGVAEPRLLEPEQTAVARPRPATPDKALAGAPGSRLRHMAPQRPIAPPAVRGGVKSGLSDDEPAVGTSQPPRIPAVGGSALRGPVVSGVSDEDQVPSNSGLARQKPRGLEPTESRKPRTPIQAGVSDESLTDDTLVTRAGVSDGNTVRSGVTDQPLLVRAGVSDDIPVRAGVSDDLAGRGEVFDAPEPVHTGDGDEDEITYSIPTSPARTAELILMPAMEIEASRVPAPLGAFDFDEVLPVEVEPEACAAPEAPAEFDLPEPVELAEAEPEPRWETTGAADAETQPYYEEPSPFTLSPAQPRELAELHLEPSFRPTQDPEVEPTDDEPVDELAGVEPLEDEPLFRPLREQAESRAIYGVSDLDDETSRPAKPAEPVLRLDLTSPSTSGPTGRGVSGLQDRTADAYSIRESNSARSRDFTAHRQLQSPPASKQARSHATRNRADRGGGLEHLRCGSVRHHRALRDRQTGGPDLCPRLACGGPGRSLDELPGHRGSRCRSAAGQCP
jgi:hypothetical protein